MANLICDQLAEWLCFGACVCCVGFRLQVGSRYAPLCPTFPFSYQDKQLLGTSHQGRWKKLVRANQVHILSLCSPHCLSYPMGQCKPVIWPNLKSRSLEIYSSFRGRKESHMAKVIEMGEQFDTNEPIHSTFFSKSWSCPRS